MIQKSQGTLRLAVEEGVRVGRHIREGEDRRGDAFHLRGGGIWILLQATRACRDVARAMPQV